MLPASVNSVNSVSSVNTVNSVDNVSSVDSGKITIRRGALCRLLVLIVLTVLIVAKRYRTLPKTRINAIPGTVLYGGILLAHPANND